MPLCRAISSCSATHRYTVGYSHRGGALLCAQPCEQRRDLVARIGCEVCQRTAALGLYVPTQAALAPLQIGYPIHPIAHVYSGHCGLPSRA
jgi:hypothetical protein